MCGLISVCSMWYQAYTLQKKEDEKAGAGDGEKPPKTAKGQRLAGCVASFVFIWFLFGAFGCVFVLSL